MTWIRTIPPQEADPALREKYAQLYAAYPAEYHEEVRAVQRPDGSADSIIASHSLIPDAMHHIFAAFAALMRPELPLTRRQHELIAACVSSINRCFYWVESHAEFLRRVTLDSALAEAIKHDYTQAELDQRDRAMLDYVQQLTKDASQIIPSDLDKLRAVGFDDRAILQINLIASWFNYINRVADGLGVGREMDGG